MMDYKSFKEAVKEKFSEYLPEKYQDVTIDISPTNKVNRTLDALFVKRNAPGRNISPIVYVNDMYEKYLASGDLDMELQSAADLIAEEMAHIPPVLSDFPMKSANDNIVFQLINTEQNRELLAEMPHREYHDLSVIYRLVAEIDETGMQSAIVNNALAERLGLDEEQLFQLAEANTKRILPPVVRSMPDVMREIFEKDGMPQEIADMMVREFSEDLQLYVISNDRGLNGAASMLYEDNLHTLASELETDLYIMPSSIHEVLAMPASMGEPNELAAMVSDINMNQVSLEERLSNQVYHYDKDLRKLTLATDTPNKSLDGIAAGQPEEKAPKPQPAKKMKQPKGPKL